MTEHWHIEGESNTDLPGVTPEKALAQRVFKKNKVKQNIVRWEPNPDESPDKPNPQRLAIESKADELFFGGAAGGGKSFLLIGLATKYHRRSIIFRREFKQLRQIMDDMNGVLKDSNAKYNSRDMIWRNIPGDRVVEFGAVENEGNEEKYQGRAHDLKAFDEITHFTEAQYRFLIAWNRTNIEEQRCRVVVTGNPPTDPEGEWVIQYWAPWLDEDHPNPAEPGELRWYVVTKDGKDLEVESGDPIWMENENGEQEEVFPSSRTFIPAFIEDNPIYMRTGYKRRLQALDEPLRSKMLKGDFTIRAKSNPWQVIPTQWVLDAQARWEKGQRPGLALRAVGVDVARGGEDKTAIARLYGNWFEIDSYPGEETPDGAEVAGRVFEVMDNNAPIAVDVVSWGASAYDKLRENENLDVTPINNSSPSVATTQDDMFGFFNLRAEHWWRMREALDPKNGHEIALPNIRELRIDLCTPRYSVVGSDIKIESKEDIVKRTKRSPDLGDAIVLCWNCAEGTPLAEMALLEDW